MNSNHKILKHLFNCKRNKASNNLESECLQDNEHFAAFDSSVCNSYLNWTKTFRNFLDFSSKYPKIVSFKLMYPIMLCTFLQFFNIAFLDYLSFTNVACQLGSNTSQTFYVSPHSVSIII